MWKLLDHLDLLTLINIFHQIEYKQMGLQEEFAMVWKSDFTQEEEQEAEWESL